MPKRIILLLDGTWNDWEADDRDTNIVRMEDLIVRTLKRTSPTVDEPDQPASEASGDPLVEPYKTKNRDNIVLYQRGVGTGADDRITGGIFGDGLPENVRRAYKFLSFHYEHDAQIFIFGFSQGAYTARSLIGYIATAGLLKRDCCSPENEEAAWEYYRTSPADRLPGDWADLTPHVHKREELFVDCIGVFDTVGALGIPLERFRLKNREKYSFHDVELSSITKVNLHAMAIDEHREPFRATIWRKPRFKKFKSYIEQVWFPGVHADIGGGYASAGERRLKSSPSLDDITLDWMLKRIKHHFHDFPVDPADPTIWQSVTSDKWSNAQQHNSRSLKYIWKSLALRAIANRPVTELGFHQSSVSYDRRDEPIGESVHISVLERLGLEVPTDKKWLFPWPGKIRYRPKNLLAILQVIEETYAKKGTEPEVHIVDWDGKQISDATRALKIIRDARERLNGGTGSATTDSDGSTPSQAAAIRS